MSTQLFINAHIATGMPGSTAAETAAIQDILVEDGKFISIAPNFKATLEAQGKDMASVEVVDLGGNWSVHHSATPICILITSLPHASPAR